MNNSVNGDVNNFVNSLVGIGDTQLRMDLMMDTPAGLRVPVELTVDFDVRLVRVRVLGDFPTSIKQEVRRVLRAAVIGSLWN